MPKASIIVPAYNAQNTLVDCLSNLVHQTLDDIEIILVNDCSTDHTLDIMYRCEEQFPDKIIVVDSDKNRGPGGARNVGLCYASGDYIGFVDSDDMVEPEMYEKLYNTAVAGNYDVVDCGFYSEKDKKAIIYTSDDLTGILNDQQRSQLIVSGGYFWSKIFRHSFLQDINLNFRENVILEDCETLMLIFAKAGSMGNVKEVLYHYKDTTQSASKCVNIPNYYNYTTGVINAIYSTLSSLDNYDGIKMAVEYSMIALCQLCYNTLLAGKQKSRISALQDIMKDKITIPLSENIYVQQKIAPKDILALQKIIL